MASGDAQRIWFSEMIEMLREGWNSSMSCEDLISLRDRIDATLQRIRAEREILPPMMRCPTCQKRYRSASPKVSVRATILALVRFRIALESEVKSLEKLWKKYMKEKDLNIYGRKEKVITTACTSTLRFECKADSLGTLLCLAAVRAHPCFVFGDEPSGCSSTTATTVGPLFNIRDELTVTGLAAVGVHHLVWGNQPVRETASATCA